MVLSEIRPRQIFMTSLLCVAKQIFLMVKISVLISYSICDRVRSTASNPHFKVCNIQVFQGTLKMAKDNGMLCDIDENLLFPNVNKLYKV